MRKCEKRNLFIFKTGYILRIPKQQTNKTSDFLYKKNLKLNKPTNQINPIRGENTHSLENQPLEN